jgi:hypothetical protein
MTQPDPVKLTVRSISDMLAAVPYILGFHPIDSLTGLAMTAARITFAARIDLPQRGATPSEVRAVAAQLTTAVRRQDTATSMTLVGYGPPERVTPTIDAARHLLTADGTPINDALRVTDGRYYSYICTEPTCCPPDGVAFQPSTSAVAATATVAGIVALPDRADLAKQVAAVDGPARDAMRAATARAITRITALNSDHPFDTHNPQLPHLLLRHGRIAVDHALHRHAALTDDEVAWLTVLLQHLPIRDLAWQEANGDHSQLALWMDVTRRAEPALVPAPASLLAFTAWQQGNGALALLALQRALNSDPSYTMALLLAEALQRCIPPSALRTWPTPPPGR